MVVVVVEEESKVKAASKNVAMESKEQTQIMKGKRTKRQRPQSPIPSSAAANSLNRDEEGGFESTDDFTDKILSPVSSDKYMDSCTEQEEDMANCLILLAQGQSIKRKEWKELAENNNTTINRKFSSRRFLETASNGDGKVGYYVYECKTCNRAFPSFQALGGHRASHKKPKPSYAEEIRNNKNRLVEPEDEDDRYWNNNSSNFSLQLGYNRAMYSNINNNMSINHKSKGNKVHECGICGAEFNSGQALGGHMRRHRGPAGAANTALSLTPMAVESDQDRGKKARNVLSLDLDLNLPAPEGDNSEPGSHFSSKQDQEPERKQEQQHPLQQRQQKQQQQQSLVFSAPTLVDCHY